MRKFVQIKHVVFSHYKNLRWYFIDTYDKKLYFISINLLDCVYLRYGIFFLFPPISIKDIKGNW